MELKDLVYIDFSAIEKHAMLISEFAEVFEYKDDTKTDKIRGYKGEFVIAQGPATGVRFNVEFEKLPNAELMHQYTIEFDEEQSSVYTNKKKFGLQFKLIGKSIIGE